MVLYATFTYLHDLGSWNPHCSSFLRGFWITTPVPGLNELLKKIHWLSPLNLQSWAARCALENSVLGSQRIFIELFFWPNLSLCICMHKYSCCRIMCISIRFFRLMSLCVLSYSYLLTCSFIKQIISSFAPYDVCMFKCLWQIYLYIYIFIYAI